MRSIEHLCMQASQSVCPWPTHDHENQYIFPTAQHNASCFRENRSSKRAQAQCCAPIVRLELVVLVGVQQPLALQPVRELQSIILSAKLEASVLVEIAPAQYVARSHADLDVEDKN